MGSDYQGRHRNAATRGTTTRHTPRSISSTLRRPVLTSSVLLAVVATTAASVSAANEHQTGAAAFSVSTEAISQANEMSDAALEDGSRLATDRNEANAAHSAAIEKTRRESVARAAAASRVAAARAAEARRVTAARAAAALTARREATARVARDSARKALVQQKQSAVAAAQSNPKSAARAMLADFGWSSGQFSCLDSLWTKESGWNYQADNPSSSAYGIPQALPGSKMASAGSDWATNPATQIKWGLGYIQDRYGSPCSAWAHSQSVNWY